MKKKRNLNPIERYWFTPVILYLSTNHYASPQARLKGEIGVTTKDIAFGLRDKYSGTKSNLSRYLTNLQGINPNTKQSYENFIPIVKCIKKQHKKNLYHLDYDNIAILILKLLNIENHDPNSEHYIYIRDLFNNYLIELVKFYDIKNNLNELDSYNLEKKEYEKKKKEILKSISQIDKVSFMDIIESFIFDLTYSKVSLYKETARIYFLKKNTYLSPSPFILAEKITHTYNLKLN